MTGFGDFAEQALSSAQGALSKFSGEKTAAEGATAQGATDATASAGTAKESTKEKAVEAYEKAKVQLDKYFGEEGKATDAASGEKQNFKEKAAGYYHTATDKIDSLLAKEGAAAKEGAEQGAAAAGQATKSVENEAAKVAAPVAENAGAAQ